jgi:type IV secretory pathway VirB10-like protein
MQWLRTRIHFGWVGGAILAMTLAYVATGTPTLLVSNAAQDSPTIPTVTQPTIPPTTVTTRPGSGAPTPAEINIMIGEAQHQAEQAKEDAQKQADESSAEAQKDADQQRADAEKQAEESRRDAEQQKADAERQADEARASNPH